MNKLGRVLIVSLVVALLVSQPALAILQETRTGIENDAVFWSGVSSPCGTSSGGSTVVSTAPATRSVAAFVDLYGKMAYDNSLKTGVPYDFTLGQAIIESGYGQSGLTKEANNFFGIKGEYNGQSVTKRTREESPSGASYYVMAKFRKYPSPQDSFNDHDNLFRTAPRYAKALKYPNDPIMFLTEVKNAGYATDSHYIQTVGSVIRSVQSYVLSKNLFPPSSQVVYTVEPVAGANTTSSSTATSAGTCPSQSKGPSDASSYQNPLREAKDVQGTRIGAGVYFAGRSTVYPIGKAVVVVALTNAMSPKNSFISYKLIDGPAAGKVIFVSGTCSSGIKKDDQLEPTTKLCDMNNEEPFTQMGWANDTGTAPADTVADDQYSVYGENFAELLTRLGAPTVSVGTAQVTETTLPTGWPTWE